MKRGDCVTLRIHSVKGSHHNVTIEGIEIGTEGAAITDDAGVSTGEYFSGVSTAACIEQAVRTAGCVEHYLAVQSGGARKTA